MPNKLEQFKKFSYDEKYKIAMNIVVNLKDKGNAQAQSIYDYIVSVDSAPEDMLESIYEDFETSIDNIKQARIGDDLHQFTKSVDYIKQLQEQEAQEREQENPDAILDQLL